MADYHNDRPRPRKRKKTAPPPTQQPDLFSLHLPSPETVAHGAAQSRENKKKGMELADKNASAAWKALADAVMEKVCKALEILASDDLWLFGLPHPREPRAMGPVVTRAMKAGWITPLIGQQRKSRRPEQNSHPLQLYRSNLYKS